MTIVNKVKLINVMINIQRRYCHTSNKNEWPKKIFSGIQPTGTVHLGNYLGAIKNWVKLQNEGSNITLSIVDLHSITLPQDPEKLNYSILETTATLLACGIDPKKSVLFLQSAVPQHTQLCWHLACLTTMARLSHLPQYKEKSSSLKDIPLGLFIYPVLQAADILVHKATHVPVGEDQIQHLQLAQTLVKMFNKRYGDTFPTPHAIVSDDSSARVRSLRDPTKKMSKSDLDPKSRISLIDTKESITEKIKKAVTDFTSEVTYEPEKRPGVSNLISMHSLLSGITPDNICEDMRKQKLDTGKYKSIVANVVSSFVCPIREEILNLLSKPNLIKDVLMVGAEKANLTAEKTLQEVQEKMGTTYFMSDMNKKKIKL